MIVGKNQLSPIERRLVIKRMVVNIAITMK
jgi:hypothetical protein